MLMPIVSMNKMAMNESVATSCCYREVVDVTNVVWKTLYGGYIGTAYKDDVTTNRHGATAAQVSFVTSNLGYDILWQDKLATYNNAQIGWGPAWGSSTSTWIVTNSSPVANQPLTEWLSANGISTSTCKHDDASCYYKDYATQIVPNQHIGATAKHDTGGTNWAKPHEAQQWSS